MPRAMPIVLGDFDGTVVGPGLEFRPRGDYDTEAAARAALAPLLAGWALEIELDHQHKVEFVFDLAVVSDPEAVKGTVHALTATGVAVVRGEASLSITMSAPLPLPTGRYQSNELTNLYVSRIRDVLEGRDKPPAAAYSLITHLAMSYGHGDLELAASTLGVSFALLKHVKRVATRNHPTQGRKTTNTNDPPLTEGDLEWLVRAMRLLVRRACAVNAGQPAVPLLAASDI